MTVIWFIKLQVLHYYTLSMQASQKAYYYNNKQTNTSDIL